MFPTTEDEASSGVTATRYIFTGDKIRYMSGHTTEHIPLQVTVAEAIAAEVVHVHVRVPVQAAEGQDAVRRIHTQTLKTQKQQIEFK